MPSETPPSRAQLLRILDLPADADDARVTGALDRLLAALSARRERILSGTEREALDREIADLEAARPAPVLAKPPDRLPLLGALLGTIVGLVALALTSDDVGPPETFETPSGFNLGQKARLEIEGALPGATLRILDADRADLVTQRRAGHAVVELDRGRYAIEVSRPDCPEPWTRSVYFSVGAVHRFAPTLCSREGALVVRANVPEGVLRIDGEVVGPPDGTPHALSVGEHEIRVERDGFRVWTEQVEIEPDATLQRTALLLPERDPTPRVRRLDLGLDAESLAPPEPQAPTPFDMEDLAESFAPAKTGRANTRLLERAGLGALSTGGSTAWHDRVSQEFLSRFDTDRSGRIDRFEESEAVTCAWWRETETSFDEGGLGLSMARYYGFDGSEWHPGALGFERGVRGVAYERMRACGLRARGRSNDHPRG